MNTEAGMPQSSTYLIQRMPQLSLVSAPAARTPIYLPACGSPPPPASHSA